MPLSREHEAFAMPAHQGHDHDHAHDHPGHDHGHRHDHHHGHHHHHHAAPPAAGFARAYAISIALNVGFVLIEGLYGFLSGSLALVADAGHNLSDVLALALAWGGSVLAQRAPSARLTYGLRGSSILAALANAVALFVVCGAIGLEAIQRLLSPTPVAGVTVMVVACIGIVVNAVSALLFRRGQDDINVRGAYLHLLADAAVSLGVVIAGAIVWLTGLQWVDPLVSLVVVIVIFVSTWGLLRDSWHLALAGVPESIDPIAVREHLLAQPGVSAVHDLHIWAMSTTHVALTAHLVRPEGHPGDAFLGRLCTSLREEFGIEHATIQIEMGDAAHPCALAPETVV